MRDDTSFAALLVVQRSGSRGIDCAEFSRAYWPEGGRQHGGGRATPGQMRTGASKVLGELVIAGRLVRHGEKGDQGRRARYTLSRAGKAFVAEYQRKMNEDSDAEDVAAGGNPIRLGPDDDGDPLPFPYGSST